MTHLDKDSVEPLILSRGSTRARVLPVNIQTIKLILTQESDGAVYESLTIGSGGNHCGESGGQKTFGALKPLGETTDLNFTPTYF